MNNNNDQVTEQLDGSRVGFLIWSISFWLGFAEAGLGWARLA